jgi:predicted MFS family arabinose efflux permease
MRIGSSIGMIAIGLILALAVPFDLGAINLQLVGWILAAVGVIGLIATVAISRRAVVTRRDVYPPDERLS